MYTWKDIKLATLQKMFSAEGTTIPTDESTQEYLAAMPYAANEALQLLSTSGKYIVKSFNLAHFPIDNLIPDNAAQQVINVVNGLYTLSAIGAKSYYFECNGIGTATITVDGTDTVISLTDKVGYTAYKGFISNATSAPVTITFKSDYPFSFKNIALYPVTFPYEATIPEYTQYDSYYIPDIAPDFYKLDGHVYFEGGESQSRYEEITKYYQEGNKTIVLPRTLIGNFRIYYDAYPEIMTATTSDDYVMPLDPDVAVMLPLYMASQLYKDDDNGIATSYRNEFEAAREVLTNKVNAATAQKFTSESGWI